MTPYDLLGSEYLLIPEEYREIVCSAYKPKIENCKELIEALEAGIKSVYDRYTTADKTGIVRSSRADKRCLQIMLLARRHVMNRMFTNDENTFNQFKALNQTLLDLSETLRKKILSLYQAWLDHEEDEWRNDCNVEGTIIAEGWKEAEGDDTGSDYSTMMSIIEDVTEIPLLQIMFSGSPDNRIDGSYRWSWGIEGNCYFSCGGPKSHGDFVMCTAFNHLLTGSLYSHQDILRIEMFWADATITHQRIVTPQGDYL